MSANLLRHFATDTQATRTGASIGAEIETHFLNESGHPIGTEVTEQLLRLSPPGPWRLTIDLGRQLLEIAVDPHPSFETLHATILEALDWLYREAATKGAYPSPQPLLTWAQDLLWIQEERDEIWVNLDGRRALEHLCRIASVQFTISVAPNEAVTILNRLWTARFHELDYPNDANWRRYLEQSEASYRPDRYAGPAGFDSLRHYASELARHRVVMLGGQACDLSTEALGSSPTAIELFLRSVWWHYRLRRYDDTLTVECRPFARRDDEAIVTTWRHIADALNL